MNKLILTSAALVIFFVLRFGGPVFAFDMKDINSITTGNANSESTVINQVNKTDVKCDCTTPTPSPEQPTPTTPPSIGGGGVGGPSGGGSSSSTNSEPAKAVLGLSNTSSGNPANSEAILLIISLMLLASGARIAFKNI